jgi:hypothetical protein
MADLDFHPSKAEQQNIGRNTENTFSNAQNEINSNRGNVPNSSKAEIASQTEAMTKGDKPLLPAFDMSQFGDESQSKQSSASTTSDAKNNNVPKESNQAKNDSASSSNTPSTTDAVTATNRGSDDATKSSEGLNNLDATDKNAPFNNGKDSSADGKTEPTSPEVNSNKNGSMDGKSEPTNPSSNTSGQSASDGSRPAGDTKPVDGSDNVTIAPPATGNASAAGSQASSRP